MLAVVISRPGGPEVLVPREVPDPSCGPEDVLVRIHATAVNRADLLQRRGRYPAPAGAPADIPGLEFAGEIEVCGPAVVDRRPGERVMAIASGGAYAERIVVPASTCIPVPDGMSWEDAAAIPEAFLTAYDALVRGRLVPGETLLVTAAGSGVGTAAVQIAAARGSTVVASSRSDAKRAQLGALLSSRFRTVGQVAPASSHSSRTDGPLLVFGAAAPNLVRTIRDALEGRGVDVILDLVGTAAWPLYLELLQERGRVVVVGTLSGSRVDLDLSVLMRRRATIIGTVLRGRGVAEKAALSADFARELLPLFADRRLRPVVDQVLPLAEAAAAHRILEENRNFGKVVLRVERA